MNTADYYTPYDKEKCDNLGGKRIRSRKVAYRKAKIVEVKDCPKTYPEEKPEPEPPVPDEEPEPTPSGPVNPVASVGFIAKAGAVPSPVKESL